MGIDLICTDSGPLVLEINPRLTLSYSGLHAGLMENPAALVLDLCRAGNFTAKPVSLQGETYVSLEDTHVV